MNRLRGVVALLLLVIGAAAARADLPGTIRLAAAGDGHVWWVVATDGSTLPDGTPAPASEREPAWLLMHHAFKEPAPTERMVVRLAEEPEAIAADGDEVVVVLPRAGGREHVVLSMRARQNAAVGHWYTEPRSGPEYLAPIEGSGGVASVAMVDGVIYALLRPGEAERPRSAMSLRLLPAEGTGVRAWRKVPLPPLGRGGPILLARMGRELLALGRVSGESMLFALEGDSWRPEPMSRGEGGGDGEDAPPPNAAAPGGGSDDESSEPLGVIEVAGRLALVERRLDADGAPRVETLLRRQGRLVPWASFGEPASPWFLAGFGDSGLLLTLDERRRASVAALAPASAEPGKSVALEPPGFAAHGWVHLPILGVLSLALVLAAVVVGSDAFLQARPNEDGSEPAPPPARPRGAPMGQRMLALAIDLIPGVAVAWAIYGGNPLELVQFPAFIPDLRAAEGAVVALAVSWFVATLGEVFVGRSLGKRVAGLSIINIRQGGRRAVGDPAGAGQRLLRALASVVVLASPFVMLLAYIHPSFDGPAEMLSGTAVVELQGPEGAGIDPSRRGDSGGDAPG